MLYLGLRSLVHLHAPCTPFGCAQSVGPRARAPLKLFSTAPETFFNRLLRLSVSSSSSSSSFSLFLFGAPRSPTSTPTKGRGG